ncbi:MAG: glycosyltransferase [Candidatus Binataceae bacterium]|nr:glycosyltransferase [Candidatus Binataceae bacterium]
MTLTVRVSTIIPAFNSAATLAAAIDSALAQEVDGQEIIVVNDGSTDATAAILASYGDRIVVPEQANRGFQSVRYEGDEEILRIECYRGRLEGLRQQPRRYTRNLRAIASAQWRNTGPCAAHSAGRDTPSADAVA